MALCKPSTFISYNLNGFNQGVSILDYLCNNSDLNVRPTAIFIQENWLTSENLNKFNKFTDYSFYGCSAMDKTLTQSVLRGRPYGGVGLLIKNDVCPGISFHTCSERFTVIVLENLLFVSVYLPSGKDDDETNQTILNTLSEIDSIIEGFPNHSVILGADLNVDLSKKSRSKDIILRFFDDNDLQLCGNEFSSNINILKYTYHHRSLPFSSYIDYFAISKNIIKDIIDFDIIDSGIDLSDHVPIKLIINLNIKVDNSKQNGLTNNCNKTRSLRWDHCNLADYYELSRQLIQPIFDQLCLFYDDFVRKKLSPNSDTIVGGANTDNEANDVINLFYNHLVNALNEAADRVVPIRKPQFFKSWWDAEADTLKQNSMKTHRAWVVSGRPLSGNLYDEKTKAKYLYKSMIKKNQISDRSTVSNSLHDSLSNKNRDLFWKIWNKKFGNAPKVSKTIDGESNEDIIVSHFAETFSKNQGCSLHLQHYFSNEFKTRLAAYVGDYCRNPLVDVDLVESVILRLPRGKAAGLDTLTCEHLQFSHPIVACVISKLFVIMIMLGYVPDAFGRGIIIPIPKGGKRSKNDKSEHYRGITISPIISKVFEMCLLDRLESYFKSSDRQFGFKKEIGCRDALFTLRKVIDTFNSNGSTVSVCSLDLKSAFDRVNHCALFIKLMDRKVPLCIINLLHNWYSKLFSKVKWMSSTSDWFRVTSGVRQGGILSPFFSLYLLMTY